jgi:ATP-dependent helicase HrpA
MCARSLGASPDPPGPIAAELRPLPPADHAAMPASLDDLRARLPGCLVADRLWAHERLARAAERLARGQPTDRALDEIGLRLAASEAEARRRADLPIRLEYPENLPVSARREEILGVIARHRAFVLTGETGSGKTTQLPKLLLEGGYGRRGIVAVTQPRRVAAYSIANRLRAETLAPEGVVAHSVRFDDRAGPDTVLRVMTDGLLLAELRADPLLTRCEAVVVDEAHERSLSIDLLLGLLRRLRERRPELLVAVSSASIEAERFAEYLGAQGVSAPIVAVSGRTFPVEIRWRPPGDDDVGYLGATVEAVREVHATRERGDCLCFLPTERDILEASRRLRDLDGSTVLPLFSRLTPGEQQRVFQGARGRKVVLATNIAETSLTIPGIRFVIDAGLARIKRYQAASRTERLPVEPVSQASCLQRAGRAGRVEAGICIRLFAEDDFAKREAFATPEIQRSNLAGVALGCLELGIAEPETFPWLDPPAPHAWRQARLLLEELGAIDARGLTPSGRAMAAIPADPQIARILLAGVAERAPHEACTIAAFLSVQDPRVRPLGLESKADTAHRSIAHEAGDIATILRLWDRYVAAGSNSARSRLCESLYLGYRRMREWADVRHQLWSSLRESRHARGGLPNAGHEAEQWPLDAVHRAVLSGMLGNVLMYEREERAYRGAGDRLLHVHPGSALRAGKEDDLKRAPAPLPWLVACEVVETSRLFARLCAPIDPEWVVALAGDRVKRRWRDPRWHAKRKQVVCVETVTWKGLPVRDGRLVPYERVDPREASAIFVREGLCGEDSGLERDHPAIARNHEVWDAAQRIRHRLRDPALHVDAAALERFYSERLGLGGEAAPVIASGDALNRWLREHGEARLALSLDDLVGREAHERADQGFPERVEMGGVRFQLQYRFAPGDDRDGATLELREEDLGAVDPARLDWLVPGWRAEMVEAWLQSLPKDSRRALIPLAETARACCEALAAEAGRRPLAQALADLLRERHGLRVPAFDHGALPPHCRLRFRIRDATGAVVHDGRDPAFLAAQAVAAGDRLAPLRQEWETAPSSSWPGDCPGQVAWRGIVGHVALERARDERGGPAARRAVYASAEAAAAWHDDGIDALLEAALGAELERLALGATAAATAARVESALGARIGSLRRQLALSAAIALERGRVADQAAWDDLLARSRAAMAAAAAGIDGLLVRAAERAEALKRRLKQGAKSLAAVATMRIATEGVERLIRPGWTQRLPWHAAARVDLFLGACERLLDLATTRPDEARRLAERSEALLGACDELLGADATRWACALGLARRLRTACASLEECLLGLATPGAGQGAGWAEGKLRQELSDIGRVFADARSRLARARSELVELRPVALRAPEPRRARLLAELDATILSLPDLSLGADLPAQLAAATALAARVRAG